MLLTRTQDPSQVASYSSLKNTSMSRVLHFSCCLPAVQIYMFSWEREKLNMSCSVACFYIFTAIYLHVCDLSIDSADVNPEHHIRILEALIVTGGLMEMQAAPGRLIKTLHICFKRCTVTLVGLLGFSAHTYRSFSDVSARAESFSP